jgi:hypothetical protein
MVRVAPRAMPCLGRAQNGASVRPILHAHRRLLRPPRFGPTCQRAALLVVRQRRAWRSGAEAGGQARRRRWRCRHHPARHHRTNPRTDTPATRTRAARDAPQRCQHARQDKSSAPPRSRKAAVQSKAKRRRSSSLRSALQSPPPANPEIYLPSSRSFVSPGPRDRRTLLPRRGCRWLPVAVGAAAAGMPAATATTARLRLPLLEAARRSPDSARPRLDCRR